MQLIIDPQGGLRRLYDEAIDLHAIGTLHLAHASYVEPDDEGRWWADLAPVGGPVLGPFTKRTQALTAETTWLEAHWLLAQVDANSAVT